jgi:hypothetical protein
MGIFRARCLEAYASYARRTMELIVWCFSVLPQDFTDYKLINLSIGCGLTTELRVASV